MLIEFSVANYLSFKEKTTFSMLASHDKTLPQNVIHNAQGSGIDLLKSAVIYGANASGKSNFVKALHHMIEFMYKSQQGAMLGDNSVFSRGFSTTLRFTKFKLDEECRKKPIEFEITILINSVRYIYGFKINHEIIIEEWLYSYPKNQKRTLFTRFWIAAEKKSSYSFNPTYFRGENNRIKSMVEDNMLFISVAAKLRNEVASSIHKWCGSQLVFNLLEIQPEIQQKNYAFTSFDATPGLKARAEELLKYSDFNIDGFEIHDEDNGNSHEYKVITHHEIKKKRGKKQVVTFNFDEESQGTQKMMILLAFCLNVFDRGGLLIVDELDSSFHPNLTRWIIELFHNKKYNKKDAQLIFTTHNTELMDKNIFKDQYDKINTGDLFRRDQIWFTERDFKTSATSMYSHWDFKDIRENENKRVNYHVGRYGAIPFLEEID